MTTHKLIATCPDSTKETVANELESLGATNISLAYMSVYFEATEENFYKIHLRCSTASQIMKIIKESSAKDEKILYSQAKRINWVNVFDSKKTYRIDTNAVAQDQGMKAVDVSKKIRASIEHVFNIKGEEIPKVSVKEPQVVFSVYLHKGRMTISVITSGLTLHKRGYKTDGHPAPLKETLSASLLQLAGYTGTEALLDPMGGSGTNVIEGCMIALNKACNIHRKKGVYGFEHLKMFDKDLWRQTQDSVRSEKKDQPSHNIYYSDINEIFVKMAKENALRARVEKHIQFEHRSFLGMKKPEENGLIVCNLPYGERIQSSVDDGSTMTLEEFYSAVGDTLKNNFDGWRVALLASEQSPWKAIRLKPSKKYYLLNGSIKTVFLIYDIRKGSFKK